MPVTSTIVIIKFEQQDTCISSRPHFVCSLMLARLCKSVSANDVDDDDVMMNLRHTTSQPQKERDRQRIIGKVRFHATIVPKILQ